MTERVRDLGTILVKNLAHNVRYGIIIEERVILERRHREGGRENKKGAERSPRLSIISPAASAILIAYVPGNFSPYRGSSDEPIR